MKAIKILVVLVMFGSLCQAQQWVPAGGGINGSVTDHAVMNNKLYIVGYSYDFNDYGLWRWDTNAWVSLWHGPEWVYRIGVYNNDIYGAGWNTAQQLIVTRFNGTGWDTIGVSDSIPALYLSSPYCPMKEFDGKLYVGSGFSSMNGVAASCIASWDGQNWSAVGAGLNARPFDFLVANNNLYVNGDFSMAGTDSARKIARWDGNSWYPLGGGLLEAYPQLDMMESFGMEIFNGDLVVSGEYVHWGGVMFTDSLVRWDGLNWSAMPLPIPEQFYCVVMTSYNASLCFVPVQHGGTYLARWDGLNWGVHSIINDIDTMWTSDFFTFNNELYMTGEIYCSSGISHPGIVKLLDPGLVINDMEICKESIRVYPNPVKDLLTITLCDDISAEYTLRNIQGELFFSGVLFNKENKIAINSLRPGMFILQVRTGNSVVCRKIFVQ